jgi:hypothetical protein
MPDTRWLGLRYFARCNFVCSQYVPASCHSSGALNFKVAAKFF